ncbi:hypothetical protein RB195_021142 [Necator americanus]|uniref:F-box domain-containing protein n=1 Tax=Necator americanus TaxID=51031 RepID=A0ABR1EAQ7_NECAM
MPARRGRKRSGRKYGSRNKNSIRIRTGRNAKDSLEKAKAVVAREKVLPELEPNCIFSFLRLPAELKWLIFNNLKNSDVIKLRLLCRQVNETIIKYWQYNLRILRTTMVDYTVSTRRPPWRSWYPVREMNQLSYRLRGAYWATIPCLSFHRKVITDNHLALLTDAVRHSHVAIAKLEFGVCEFKCNVDLLTAFFKECRTEKVLFVVKPHIMKFVDNLRKIGYFGRHCTTMVIRDDMYPISAYGEFFPNKLKF